MEEALQQGAAGISLGLMYDPGLFAQKEELKKVAALCAKYDRPLTVHPCANSAVSMSYNENCLYMTDAWVEEFGVQNPAIYDCFPKFLRDALNGTGDTLENTIRRMTGATADRFKLSDRGYIRPGCFADLTVFDEKEIRAAQPDQEKSFGIKQVFINGRQVLREGTLDKEALKTTGRAIRVG